MALTVEEASKLSKSKILSVKRLKKGARNATSNGKIKQAKLKGSD